jgi:hypothetical protein
MPRQSLAPQAKRAPAMVFDHVWHVSDREGLLEA